MNDRWTTRVDESMVAAAGGDGPMFLSSVVDSEGKTIATIQAIDALGEAHATLMAAAPEMLQALQYITGLFRRVGFQEIRGEAWHDGDLEAIHKLIDKATT